LNLEVAKPLHLARQRRQRAAWVFDLRPEMLVFATIVLVALTSMLYLTQASNVAATGYDITYAEDRREKLERERQRLTLRAAELQSLDRLEREATSTLKMVPAPVPDYLPARQSPVDVEAAVARAEREARHEPRGWREQLAALLRVEQLDRAGG
jgi:cell division protein FtsL